MAHAPTNADIVALELPSWDIVSLALPADKDELLACLDQDGSALTSSEREFIDKANSVPKETRMGRYEELRSRTARCGLQPPVGKGLRDEDLMPLLCAMWYYACKIMFDIGMPEWNIDWVNSSPYGEEYEAHFYGNEPDPFVLLQLDLRAQAAKDRKTLQHNYGPNPFLHWQWDANSYCSDYERLPTDYARISVELQDNLVVGLESLGPLTDTARRVKDLIKRLPERMHEWLGKDDFSPEDLFAHPSMPMYGGGLVDTRLHCSAGVFMEAMLDHAVSTAAGVMRMSSMPP